MDDSGMFLVGLNGLFGVEVPDVDDFVVTRDNVGGGWGEFAVPNPVVVPFERELQSAIDSRPNLHQFVVSTRGKQKAITAEANTPDSGIMGFNKGDFLGFTVKVDLPEFDGLVAT